MSGLLQSMVLKPCATGLALGAIGLLAACTDVPQPNNSVSPSPTISPTIASPTSTPISPSPIPSSPSPTASPTGSPITPTPSPSASKSAATQQTEEKLIKTLTKAADVKVQTVNCPPTIEFQVGKTYNCQMASSIGDFTVVVEIKDQKGDFKWSTQGLLVLSKLEEYIQKSTKEKGGGEVQVACGGKARLAKPGEEFQCKVIDAKGQSRTAKVTVQDEQGSVFFTLL